MRLREHRRNRIGDPLHGIEGGDDHSDAHAASVRLGSRTKR
jgi:hypothetical protein